LKNETVFLHVLASPGRPWGTSLYISRHTSLHIGSIVSTLL